MSARARTVARLVVLAALGAAVPVLVAGAIALEAIAGDAVRSARIAQGVLAAAAAIALAVSLRIAVPRSRRVLDEVAADERGRMAGRIAGGVSHDLGHRVAVLQHLARLAEEGEASGLQRIRDTLRAEVATLRTFVGDFSDLSRDVAVDAVPVELGAFARSVVRTATARAEASGVRLVAIAPPVGAWIRTDRHLLERATLNLLWNAIEASRPGAEVRVRVAPDSRPAVVALVVEDDGAGIAPERLPGIFDGFASTKGTRARVGFGLAIVKRIAGLLGATVAMESAPGKGTQVRVAVPRAEPPDDADDAEEHPASAG